MKKTLGIIVLSLLITCNSFSDDRDLNSFNKWLTKNGHYNFVNEVEIPEICKKEKRYSHIWYYNKCDEVKSGNKLKIKFYKNRSNIPWNAKPNYDTLLYYFFSYINRANKGHKVEIKASKKPYEFKFDLKKDKYINKQMQKTAIVSYLLFEDGKITIDEKSPKDRFGILIKDDTKLLSMSVGKSMVSYVLGHAICSGYIDNVNSKIDDWPLIKNTLYDGQQIIDLINMSAGDQKYINVIERIKKTGKQAGSGSIKYHMEGVFNGSKKSKAKWNYNGLIPHIILNYIQFKSDEDYQKILDQTFKEKSKIKDSVYFKKKKGKNYDEGLLTNSFHASRYDYLRISKAMLDDWQNDTCVGKYLKTIYKNKVKKNNEWKDDKSMWFNPKSYAGFFHTDYTGMKKRAVMGMDGYGGQSMIIDFDLGRIIIINSIHTNYNWKKIAHSVIKKGK